MSRPIVASHMPETLWRLPATWARRCCWCKQITPPRSGGLPTWTVDGLCPRCRVAIELASTKGLQPMTIAEYIIALRNAPGVTLAAVRVLLELLARGADSGWSSPTSAHDLGDALQLNETTTKRALSWLLASQLLEAQYVSGPRGGRRRVFRLSLPTDDDASQQGGAHGRASDGA